MAGLAWTSSRRLLFLWVLFLSIELKYCGLVAAFGQQPRETRTVATAQIGSWKVLSPFQWPLAEIAQGAAVAGAISTIMEEHCSGGRTFADCMEKLPPVDVARILEQAAVSSSAFGLGAVVESFANPNNWQRVMAVQKEGRRPPMGCEELVAETCLRGCHEHKENIDGCTLLCTLKQDECERHSASISIDNVRQERAKTVRHELASCQADLGSAVVSQKHARKAEMDLQERLDAAERNLADGTNIIASLEESIEREAASCKKNPTVTEDAAEKARLQRTRDNAEYRREMALQKEVFDSDLADKTARIASLEKVVELDAARWKSNWDASRTTTECERDLRRWEDEWSADAAAYEEEVKMLSRCLLTSVSWVSTAILALGFCCMLSGQGTNPPASGPKPQQPRYLGLSPNSVDASTPLSPPQPPSIGSAETPRASSDGPIESSNESSGHVRDFDDVARPSISGHTCDESGSSPANGKSDHETVANAVDESLDDGISSTSDKDGSASTSEGSSVESNKGKPAAKVLPTTELIAAPADKKDTDRDRANLWMRLRERGLGFLARAADYNNHVSFDSIFKVGNRIGAGGYGEVCRLEIKYAGHRQLLSDFFGHSRGLVLKRLMEDNPNADAREGIETEIRIAQSLPPGGHPNIIRHVSSNMATGAIAMEAMAFDCFELLSDENKRSRASSGKLHRIVQSTAYGLKFMHQNKITNGDVKLANVLLSEDLTEVKLSDWGISGRSGKDCTWCASLPSTAPELVKFVRSSKSLPLLYMDPSQDVYSYGLFYWQVINKMAYMPTDQDELERYNPDLLINNEAFERVRLYREWCQRKDDREGWSAGVEEAERRECYIWEAYEGTRVKMNVPLSEDLLSVDRCPEQGDLQHPEEVTKFVSAMLHPDPERRVGMDMILDVLAYPQLSARIEDPPVGLPAALKTLLGALVVAGVDTEDHVDQWWTQAPLLKPTRRGSTPVWTGAGYDAS